MTCPRPHRVGLATILVVLLSAPTAPATTWMAPVPGEVRAVFRTVPDPFAAGQHRGVDLDARRGATVRAPCRGTVRFAGPLPRHGLGVTIACGRYAATVLDMGRVRVRRGEDVGRGAPIGTAAAATVHLGARRLARRRGYVDPLGLLGDGRTRRPLSPAPAGRRRGPGGDRRPLVSTQAAPARAVPSAAVGPPAPVAPPAPAAPPASAAPPVGHAPAPPATAWGGLALVLGGLGAGTALRRSRRAARPAGAGSRVGMDAR